MESEGEPIIRETAEAMAREMDFYKELKRRRNIMNIWRPKAELTPQQEIAYQQSTCDPVLRDVAKAVLEEIQYNRNERSMAMKLLIYFLIFIVVIVISMPTIIIWLVKRSGKHK